MELSIIIPTLNEEFYLPKLLESLSKQTFTDFETIVVDGESRDKTVSEAIKFNDKMPLRILETKKGIGRQRNLGAAEASASLLLFLDADVIPEPDFLKTLIGEVEERKIDACICELTALTKNPLVKMAAVVSSFVVFKLISPFYKNTTGADFLVKKEAFEKVKGFDEQLIYAEDNDLLKRLIRAGFKYEVLSRPKISMSLRRFERDGYLRYGLKTLLSMILIATLGTKRAQRIVGFEFGGHRPPKNR